MHHYTEYAIRCSSIGSFTLTHCQLESTFYQSYFKSYVLLQLSVLNLKSDATDHNMEQCD